MVAPGPLAWVRVVVVCPLDVPLHRNESMTWFPYKVLAWEQHAGEQLLIMLLIPTPGVLETVILIPMDSAQNRLMKQPGL